MDTITITRVETREQAHRSRPLYRITDATGQQYATENSWLASLCQRALDLNLPVEIRSSHGWYYREILAVALPEKAGAA